MKDAQHTVRFHVDDLMSSHRNKTVNDEFEAWLQEKYGKLGKVKATRGHEHDYLGMTIRFNDDKSVTVDMVDYVAAMLSEFPKQFKPNETAPTPATEKLFNTSSGALLIQTKAEVFYTAVAKGLFVSKRARPDIMPTIAVLCTRVKAPTDSDWDKLMRMMKYLNGTRNKTLTMKADDLKVIKLYVDASFAVHPDFWSHTGGVMTMGSNTMQTILTKQKLNTRSSTEAKLVGADDAMGPILWTRFFPEEQGYDI